MKIAMLVALLFGQNLFLSDDTTVSIHEDAVRKFVAEKPIDTVFRLNIDGLYSGSCVSIGNGEFLTAAHCFDGIRPEQVISIKYDGKVVPCKIVKRVRNLDYAIITGDVEIPAALIGEMPKIGDKVQSIGADAEGLMITVTGHNVSGIDADIATNQFANLGRSGGGLFKDGKLVGILSTRYPPNTTFYKPAPTFDLTTKQYRVKFYSGKFCRFCKQQHAITDAVNDDRIVADWTEDDLPKNIGDRLPRGYMLPVPVVINSKGEETWPTNSRVRTLDELVEFCVLADAVPIKTVKAMGARRDRKKQAPQAMGAMQCRSEVLQLLAGWDKYIGQDIEAYGSWSRSGKQVFAIYPSPQLTGFKDVFGLNGGFRFECKSPKLPIEKLGLTYRVDENDGTIIFDMDPIAVKGLIDKYNEQFGERDKAMGIDPLTIYTIVSTIRTIWILFHPVADLYVGGDISLRGRLHEQMLILKFEQMPEIRIVWLFSFKLGVKEVQITPEYIKLLFTGSRWVTEKQFDITE